MSPMRDMEHPAALKATADLSTSLRAAQDDRCLEGIVLSHPSSKKRSMDGAPGLKKLVEHIWMLIGVSRTCENMVELRQRMAELNGRTMVQLMLPLPRPAQET